MRLEDSHGWNARTSGGAKIRVSWLSSWLLIESLTRKIPSWGWRGALTIGWWWSSHLGIVGLEWFGEGSYKVHLIGMYTKRFTLYVKLESFFCTRKLDQRREQHKRKRKTLSSASKSHAGPRLRHRASNH